MKFWFYHQNRHKKPPSGTQNRPQIVHFGSKNRWKSPKLKKKVSFRSIDFSSEKKKRKKLKKGAPQGEPDLAGERKAQWEIWWHHVAIWCYLWKLIWSCCYQLLCLGADVWSLKREAVSFELWALSFKLKAWSLKVEAWRLKLEALSFELQALSFKL